MKLHVWDTVKNPLLSLLICKTVQILKIKNLHHGYYTNVQPSTAIRTYDAVYSEVQERHFSILIYLQIKVDQSQNTVSIFLWKLHRRGHLYLFCYNNIAFTLNSGHNNPTMACFFRFNRLISLHYNRMMGYRYQGDTEFDPDSMENYSKRVQSPANRTSEMFNSYIEPLF